MRSDLVHIGKDGWLFLVAGSYDVIGQVDESDLVAAMAQTGHV